MIFYFFNIKKETNIYKQFKNFELVKECEDAIINMNRNDDE